MTAETNAPEPAPSQEERLSVLGGPRPRREPEYPLAPIAKGRKESRLHLSMLEYEI